MWLKSVIRTHLQKERRKDKDIKEVVRDKILILIYTHLLLRHNN